MKAEKTEDGIILLGDKRFLRIHGAVAWGDPSADDPIESGHAVVIAGEYEDSRISVRRQFIGKFLDLSDELIRLKDDFFVSAFWLPPEPEGLVQQLLALDGLTRYIPRSRDANKRTVYKVTEPFDKWPSFRAERPTAILPVYSDIFLTDFESCRIKVDQLIRGDKVRGDMKMLGPLEKELSGLSTGEAAKRPLFRALVGVVYQLWLTSAQHRVTPKTPATNTPWMDYERIRK
jgi:hypothetical protein